MASLFLVMTLAAFVAAWHWFVDKKTGGRMRSPLWLAFSSTAAATLFLVAGAVGYRLSHGVPFMNPMAWTDRVIWPQIWVGAVTALIAAYLWRLGLRSLRSSQASNPSA